MRFMPVLHFKKGKSKQMS